jgi:hypothetical protein
MALVRKKKQVKALKRLKKVLKKALKRLKKVLKKI